MSDNSNLPKIPPINIPTSVDPVVVVNSILNTYKDIKMNEQDNITERTRIREQARVYIATIEANTKMFQMAIDKTFDLRMKLVEQVGEICKRDCIDEYSLKLCEMLLGFLSQPTEISNVDFSAPKLLK